MKSWTATYLKSNGIQACEEISHHGYEVDVGSNTGIEKGEILGLTWDRVDLEQRTILLGPENTKTRRGRTIPICKELHETLSELARKATEALVITYQNP